MKENKFGSCNRISLAVVISYFLTILQDYCRALAKELGCFDYWTDREKVETVGFIATAVGAAALAFKLMSSK